MAANTKNTAKVGSGTQASASFADIINFSNLGDCVTVDNRSTTVNLWMTYACGATAATPTSGGDDCYYIPAGAFRVFPFPAVTQVKLIADAATSLYTVAVM